MSYKDLEDKITQDKIAIRYNVVAEGAAMKAEDYPEVKEILPTEEPFRKIALEILYEDKRCSEHIIYKRSLFLA